MFKNKISSTALTIIIMFTFFLFFIINKEILRPKYGSLPVIGVVLGSLPNFLGAFIYSIVTVVFLTKKKHSFKRASIIAFLIFIFLTIEEYYPFFTASRTFDYYDILASGIGCVSAVLYYNWEYKKTKLQTKM